MNYVFQELQTKFNGSCCDGGKVLPSVDLPKLIAVLWPDIFVFVCFCDGVALEFCLSPNANQRVEAIVLFWFHHSEFA